MQHVKKTSNSPRGSRAAPEINPVEGLGIDRATYLLHGPARGGGTLTAMMKLAPARIGSRTVPS